MKNVIRVDCWISLTGGVAWTWDLRNSKKFFRLRRIIFWTSQVSAPLSRIENYRQPTV